MKTGIKHLIKCRCTLAQFKNRRPPVVHHFVVFSVIDENDLVIVKYAQCNNCGIIHKVTDICTSEFINKEDNPTLISIDDLKLTLPDKVVALLEQNDADLASWEYVSFILKNKQWGNYVVLSTDKEADTTYGKILRIFGENMFEVDSFSREEVTK